MTQEAIQKVCQFEGCGKTVVARGWCMGHYHQWYEGRDLKPLRRFVRTPQDANGRVCTECFQYKTWDNFYVSQGKRRSKCKRCVSTSMTRR